MALSKTISYKGFTTLAYAKITSFTLSDYLEEGVKKFRAQVCVNIYTNSTKEFDIEQVVKIADGFDHEPTIAELYEAIKPEFADWTNI